MNQYCMFKGKLQNAAPFKPQYPGSPHYVINVKGSDDTIFKIVVNSASTEIGEDGNNNVYFYADLNFTDPLTEKLGQLPYGLQTTDFPGSTIGRTAACSTCAGCGLSRTRMKTASVPTSTTSSARSCRSIRPSRRRPCPTTTAMVNRRIAISTRQPTMT